MYCDGSWVCGCGCDCDCPSACKGADAGVVGAVLSAGLASLALFPPWVVLAVAVAAALLWACMDWSTSSRFCWTALAAFLALRRGCHPPVGAVAAAAAEDGGALVSSLGTMAGVDVGADSGAATSVSEDTSCFGSSFWRRNGIFDRLCVGSE